MAVSGSPGEHAPQERFGTQDRAAAFYKNQMLDHLNAAMRAAQQEMVFIATADAHGACDGSFRAGLPGFVRVLDAKTVLYPEYRGNGVLCTLKRQRQQRLSAPRLDVWDRTDHPVHSSRRLLTHSRWLTWSSTQPIIALAHEQCYSPGATPLRHGVQAAV